MEKNKIYVTRPSMPPFDEYISEIRKIWDNRILTNMGELHNKLERKLMDYLKVDNLVLTSNGHNALEIAIQALGLEGEVITTPFTFVSTTHAIVRNNLKPVFCDIKDIDYTMDENKIEDLITERTSAILPVHVYGNVCNIDAIEKIAKKHSIKVIYDAAHTFGETYRGKSVCSYGDLAVLSFHATKTFNTVEGGAVCTPDYELYEIMSQIRNFGISNAECVEYIGTNAKMDELHAAMGICNLRYYNVERRRRKEIVEAYLDLLSDVKGIKLPGYRNEIEYNYAYFPIYVCKKKYGSSRDELCEWLREESIFARKYFYPLTNDMKCYGDEFEIFETPVAKKMASGILCLPLYAAMELEDVNHICKIIKEKK